MRAAFSGQTWLITGASRGFGAAVSKLLAQNGAHVIALARTVGALEELDDTIATTGGTCTLIPFDLAKTSELEALGPMLAGRFPHLDGWVSCAMQLGGIGPIAHSTPTDYTKLLTLTVTANVQMIRTLDPLLRAAPAAQVVFVTDSMGDKEGPAYWGPYGIAKAALKTLADTYAAEQGTTQIKVHTFDPGIMATSLRFAAYPGEDAHKLPPPDTAAQRLVDRLLA